MGKPGPLWALGYMYTYPRSYSGWQASATMITTFGILSEQLYKYTKPGNDSQCKTDYRWDNFTQQTLNDMGETFFRLAMDGKLVMNLTVLSTPNGIFLPPQTVEVYHTHKVIFYNSDYK